MDFVTTQGVKLFLLQGQYKTDFSHNSFHLQIPAILMALSFFSSIKYNSLGLFWPLSSPELKASKENSPNMHTVFFSSHHVLWPNLASFQFRQQLSFKYYT